MKLVLSLCSLTFAVFASAESVNLADVDLVNTRSGAAIKPNTSQAIRSIAGGAIYFEDFQTQADPNNPVFPLGWTLINNDGLTPASAVNYVTDAWVTRDDFVTPSDPTDYAMFSTSWYSPAGTADDWGITPAIQLPMGQFTLSWVANAPDSAYADGYEVYVSNTTADIAGCTGGDMIFSTPGENSVDTFREVDVPLAYQNQSVYFCFRNNSNDKFLLIIDDISVEQVYDHDVQIDSVATPPEYTVVPDKNGMVEVPIAVTINNVGVMSQSNIDVVVDIELDSAPHVTLNANYPGPLVSGATDTLDLGTIPVVDVGVYDLTYTVSLDGVTDENPGNNTASIMSVIEISTDTMARDDGIIASTLGIGAGDGGYLGNMFEFAEPVTLSGVNFVYSNNSCDTNPPNDCSLDGESTQVDVFQIDEVTGLPGTLIASTEAHVIPAGQAESTSVDANFAAPLNLMPGQYVFALVEPVRTTSTFGTISLQVNTSTDRFTSGTVWINWPSNPLGAWSHVEEFGAEFERSFLIRPMFVETDLIFRDGFE